MKNMLFFGMFIPLTLFSSPNESYNMNELVAEVEAGQELRMPGNLINRVAKFNGDEYSPISWLICQKKSPAVLKVFLNKAYVDPIQMISNKPLIHLAIRSTVFEYVDLLLSQKDYKNKDIDLVDDFDLNALHLAAILNQPKTIQRLLLAGANINFHNFYGNTALHYAAGNLHLEAVFELIKHSAQVTFNNEGLSPIDLAYRNETSPARQEKIGAILLRQKLYPNVKKAKNINPVKLSISQLHEKLTAMIINSQYHSKILPFLSANRDLDLNFSDQHKITPLMDASMTGSHKVVSLLILHGANPELQDDKGLSALHYAASLGHLEVVEKLLSHYAGAALLKFLDLRSKEGQTALHMAAKDGFYDICSMLIKHGARLLRDNAGYYPLAYVKKTNIRKMLRETEKLEIKRMGQGAHECPVCLSKFSSLDSKLRRVFVTHCRHVMHKSCLKKCVEQSASCPICRSSLNCNLCNNLVSALEYNSYLSCKHIFHKKCVKKNESCSICN